MYPRGNINVYISPQGWTEGPMQTFCFDFLTKISLQKNKTWEGLIREDVELQEKSSTTIMRRSKYCEDIGKGKDRRKWALLELYDASLPLKVTQTFCSTIDCPMLDKKGRNQVLWSSQNSSQDKNSSFLHYGTLPLGGNINEFLQEKL